MADFHQLQQVFMNLIGNAQDAMEQQSGERRLSIKTRKIGSFIRVEIADNGPGIPAECLESIFEPFFTTKEPGKGTGLGLSISFGIIAGHSGRIWAENIPGGGARFSIELPIVGDAAEDKKAAGAAPQPARPARARRRRTVRDGRHGKDLHLLNLSPDTARDAETARKN